MYGPSMQNTNRVLTFTHKKTPKTVNSLVQ